VTVRDDVLDVLRSFGPSRSEDVGDEIHAATKAVYLALQALRSEGLAALEGRGTSARWVAAEGPLPRPPPPSVRARVLTALRAGASSLREVAEAAPADRASAHRALRALERDGVAERASKWPVRWRVR